MAKYFKEMEMIKKTTLAFSEIKKRRQLDIMKDELQKDMQKELAQKELARKDIQKDMQKELAQKEIVLSRESDSNRRHSDLQSDVTTRLNYRE